MIRPIRIGMPSKMMDAVPPNRDVLPLDGLRGEASSRKAGKPEAIPSALVEPSQSGLDITAVMRVLQFGDSALPVGAFSFSNGLESAIQEGLVRDKETLRQFVATVTHQSASADGIALLCAHRAASAHDITGVVQADSTLFNRKLNEEMRTMTVRMGKKLGEVAHHLLQTRSLGDWLRRVERKETPGTYPIALGVVFADLGLPERAAFAVQQYGTASMILNASLRLMKIHHFDAQRILLDTNARADEEYLRVSRSTLQDMATFCPLLDIVAAAHVKAHIRMFMN